MATNARYPSAAMVLWSPSMADDVPRANRATPNVATPLVVAAIQDRPPR
ncbi:MAG: hypothetical protein M3011_09560 [Actinomycetota bacterium]|nr:hypothetical protein [Actinomycetota bacterium]